MSRRTLALLLFIVGMALIAVGLLGTGGGDPVPPAYLAALHRTAA